MSNLNQIIGKVEKSFILTSFRKEFVQLVYAIKSKKVFQIREINIGGDEANSQLLERHKPDFVNKHINE